jgi:hypothetical protein
MKYNEKSLFNRFYRLMIPSGLLLFLVHSYYSLLGPLQPFPDPNFPTGYPFAFRLAGAFLFGPVSIGLGWLISLKFRDNLIGPILIHWGCAIGSNISHSFIPPIWGALSLYYSMAVVLPGMALMLGTFPSGRGVTLFWDRVTKGLVFGAMGYFLLVNLAAPKAYGTSAPSPLAIQTLIPFFDQINGPLPIILAGLFLTGSALTIYRYRITHEAERKQMRWLVGIALFFAILNPLDNLLQISGASNITTKVLVGTAAFTVPSLGISLAILQHHLWDIDVIIRRTLQYSVLTGLLALIYFGLVVVFQTLFSTISNQQSEIFIVISTLVIAAIFNPLRNRVQAFIDRRFYRKKYNAEQALAQFALTARDEVDMDKLTAALLGVVEETVQPETVSLWLKVKGGRS